MKKIALLLSILVTACSQQHTVEGYIAGLTNDTISMIYGKIADMSNGYAHINDTIYAHDGSFAFDIPSDDAYFVKLRPMQSGTKISDGVMWNGWASEIELFIDKGERISVDGSIDSTYIYYSASGSQVNADYSALRAGVMPLLKQCANFSLQANLSTSDKEFMQLMSQYQKVFGQISSHYLDFIRMHPDRALSGYLVRYAPMDSIEYYCNMLTADAQESMFAPAVDALVKYVEAQKFKLEAKERIAVGNIAPDFTLEKRDGTKFTLSSLRGKYVLLDFWGSWCGWCIKGFPKLKEFYSKNKERVEVVGIDCKDSRENWLAAVEMHSLPWINVYNPDDAEVTENVLNLYNVNSFPTKILLGPEGRIIEICIGEKSDFYDTIADKLN